MNTFGLSGKIDFRYMIIGFIICSLLILITSPITPPEQQTYSKTMTLMGTEVTITVVSTNAKQAYNAIDLAFAEMKRIESMMSIYNPKSDLSLLNEFSSENVNTPIKIDPELYLVIEQSVKISELTDGAFDITVNPILELWSDVKNTKVFPTEEQVTSTLQSVGYRYLKLSDNSISFHRSGMSINLGGIAKGYAVDKAIAILESEGIQSALVDAGGDIRTYGVKPDNTGWSVALRNPRDHKDYITIIESKDTAVVTSGDYERFFDTEDGRVIHIADPRTGYSAKGTMGVTIIAKDAIFADALATGIFVLGKSSLDIIESLPDTEALLIDENRTVYRTSGFQDFEISD